MNQMVERVARALCRDLIESSGVECDIDVEIEGTWVAFEDDARLVIWEDIVDKALKRT